MVRFAYSRPSSSPPFPSFPRLVRERPEACYGETSPATARTSEADGSSVVDPWDDVDALEELAERIAVLAAHIRAAEHELLVLVAEYDRRRGWELDGHRSCAYWLAARTGIGLAAARER